MANFQSGGTKRSPPTPEELWGDCEIAGWDHHNIALWHLWLKNLATLIIFAEQPVIDRIMEVVRSTIEAAKAGELTAEQAVWKISPQTLIYQKEWEAINAAARKDGSIIGRLYFDGGNND